MSTAKLKPLIWCYLFSFFFFDVIRHSSYWVTARYPAGISHQNYISLASKQHKWSCLVCEIILFIRWKYMISPKMTGYDIILLCLFNLFTNNFLVSRFFFIQNVINLLKHYSVLSVTYNHFYPNIIQFV